jgi:hypothetical protein
VCWLCCFLFLIPFSPGAALGIPMYSHEYPRF